MKLGSPSGPPLGFFGHLTAVPLQGSSPSCQEGTSSVVPRGPSVSEKGWSTNGIYVSVCMCTSVHTHPYIHTYRQTDRQTDMPCHAMPCHAIPNQPTIHTYITLHYIPYHTITLHYIALHCSTLQYITVQYIHTCTVHIYIHT